MALGQEEQWSSSNQSNGAALLLRSPNLVGHPKSSGALTKMRALGLLLPPILRHTPRCSSPYAALGLACSTGTTTALHHNTINNLCMRTQRAPRLVCTNIH